MFSRALTVNLLALVSTKKTNVAPSYARCPHVDAFGSNRQRLPMPHSETFGRNGSEYFVGKLPSHDI